MKDIVISIKENGKYFQVASRRDGWKLTLTPMLHKTLKDWLAKDASFLNLNWKEFEPRLKESNPMNDGNEYIEQEAPF
jgi:hypothetical protein